MNMENENVERGIDAKMMDTKEVNKTIKQNVSGNGEEKILVQNVPKLDNVAVGLKKNVNITIRNDVGDLVGALNDGASIRIEGNAGRYVGDGMTAGEIIIEGNAEEGAGSAMCGGTVVIKGSAQDHVGQLLKGGTILIVGSVGDFSASFMIAGKMVIGGDAGIDLGSSMIAGTIYIRGDYERLGPKLDRTELTDDDKKFLRELFEKYQVQMKAEEFKKIVPQKEMT
jgi:glutamate synthase domain-containing protein 3